MKSIGVNEQKQGLYCEKHRNQRKSIVFGFVVTWIAVYQGYESQPTSAGIANATTRTVVYSSLAILGLDFVLTAMMIGGW